MKSRFNLPEAALALVTGVCVLASACDSGDGSATPSAVASAEPTAQATVEPLPTIEGNVIESPAKGYRATFPDGWNPRANLATAGGLRADAFFAPEMVDEIQPNISVVCQAKEIGTTDEWAAERLETLQALERSNIEERPETQIAETRAVSIGYTIERFGASVAIEEIVFVASSCDWIVALTVPSGASSDYRAEFSAFVASFELIETP